MQQQFLNIADSSQTVIACRVSPKQKADLIYMIKQKHKDKLCLAVGDGANDVSMLRMAHVGIGISGYEGQQASRAADYAIGQFSFLQDLILFYGREYYRRNSYLICYIFYKNIFFVMTQFFFGFLNVFSCQNIFETWIYSLFNIIFTLAPIMIMAIFDSQYPKYVFKSKPELYRLGPQNKNFSIRVFWQWVLEGTFEAAIIVFLTCYSFEEQALNSEGQPSSFWVTGCIIYFGIVAVSLIILLTPSFRSVIRRSWQRILLTRS